MKEKVKCRRCIEVTSLETRIKNTSEAINSMKSKGMKTYYLDDGLLMLEAKKRGVEAMKCCCVWLEQAPLPFGNTGVKISAFRASDSTKAEK